MNQDENAAPDRGRMPETDDLTPSRGAAEGGL